MRRRRWLRSATGARHASLRLAPTGSVIVNVVPAPACVLDGHAAAVRDDDAAHQREAEAVAVNLPAIASAPR